MVGRAGLRWATVLGAFAISTAVAAPALGREQEQVDNCAGGARGVVELVSPTADSAVEDGWVTVEVRYRCKEGLPFSVAIDGVGYNFGAGSKVAAPGRGAMLVADPAYNEGCEDCLPQLGLNGESSGFFRRKALVGPGRHRLALRPGTSGTDLPKFKPLRVTFGAEPATLPDTGSARGEAVMVALMSIAAGVAALKRFPRVS